MIKTASKTNNMEACRLFSEIEAHLINDDAPSDMLKIIYKWPEFENYPFSMLKKLEKTQQSPAYHPEGNVWNHTLLVVDEAAKRRRESNDPRAFMWAALLHDIGKPATTRNHKGRITAYDHDKAGAQLTREFLSVMTEDRRFVDKVAHLVKFHMQILYVVNDLPFKDIDGMKRHTDIHEIALLCLCDRLGRAGAQRKTEEEHVRMFVDLCDYE